MEVQTGFVKAVVSSAVHKPECPLRELPMHFTKAKQQIKPKARKQVNFSVKIS